MGSSSRWGRDRCSQRAWFPSDSDRKCLTHRGRVIKLVVLDENTDRQPEHTHTHTLHTHTRYKQASREGAATWSLRGGPPTATALAAAHLRVPGAHSCGEACEPRQSLSRPLGLENNYAARPIPFIHSGLGLCICSKKPNVPSEKSISCAEYSREHADLNRREAPTRLLN